MYKYLIKYFNPVCNYKLAELPFNLTMCFLYKN